MPSLKELACLGKQALLALVAELLTELATLKTRVADLLSDNAALKAQLDQMTRDSKRQAPRSPKANARPIPNLRVASRGGVELLFRVFADRYEQGSILVTSNLPFSEWGQVFQGERMTAALLDRITHRCAIVETGKESYRLRDARRRRRGPALESAQTPSTPSGPSSSLREPGATFSEFSRTGRYVFRVLPEWH